MRPQFPSLSLPEALWRRVDLEAPRCPAALPTLEALLEALEALLILEALDPEAPCRLEALRICWRLEALWMALEALCRLEALLTAWRPGTLVSQRGRVQRLARHGLSLWPYQGQR